MELSWVTQWPAMIVVKQEMQMNCISYYIITLGRSYQTIVNLSISQGHTSSSSIPVCTKPAVQQNSHNMNLKPLWHCTSKRCTVNNTNPSIQKHPQKDTQQIQFHTQSSAVSASSIQLGNLQNLQDRSCWKELRIQSRKMSECKMTLQTAPNKQYISEIYNLFVPIHKAYPSAMVSIWHFLFLFLWLQYRFLISVHSLLK